MTLNGTLAFRCSVQGYVAITTRVIPRRDTERDRLGLYGQATKRMWWMPWRQQAMKDVAACEKPRGAGKQALIRGCPNGETRPGEPGHRHLNS